MTDQLPSQLPDWTIMVYISADNVLTNFAVESLKQLKRSAGDGVVVAVQVDASGGRKARRYRFDGSGDKNSSIERNRVNHLEPAPTKLGVADPDNLAEFIKWAAKGKEYDARHRCLFLWGHGYELLLNEDQPGNPDVDDRKYLTPKGLNEALTKAGVTSQDLDIIGIDACSMSLIELASELQGRSKYMIASQEDVPDTSFPYEQMLSRLRSFDPDNPEAICAAIPGLYKEAYQDYILGTATGVKAITLSSLRLDRVTAITAKLKTLATALKPAPWDVNLRKDIREARAAARDFALGLFVDIADFCAQLAARTSNGEVKSACQALIDVIDAQGPDAPVLSNEHSDGAKKECHGVSIYFPYLVKGALEQEQNALVNSQTTMTPQLSMLVKGGTNHLLKSRAVKISQMEQDFDALSVFDKTGWSEFIRCVWSVILAADEPQQLSEHYSAEQCAINLLSMLKPKVRSATA